MSEVFVLYAILLCKRRWQEKIYTGLYALAVLKDCTQNQYQEYKKKNPPR